MKIAYCIPSIHFTGGMERVLLAKANYFVEHFGYEVHILITEGKGLKPYYYIHPAITIHQLDIDFESTFSMPILKKLYTYYKKQQIFKKRMNECLCQIKPDITISLLRRDINIINKMTDGSIKMGEIHFARQFYREINSNKLPGFVKKAIKSLWMSQLICHLKKLDSFIVLSNEDAAKWTELNNVHVIYYPVPFTATKRTDYKQKSVIAAGRYTYQKGFDLLVEAWTHVADRHHDWTLNVYGNGDRSEIERLVEEKGLRGKVILNGNASNIEDKYCESSIFVFSSRFEGFGMVLVEAMSCGLPAVSFACPCGPRDIITDGEDGILVENGNTTALGESINRMIEDEEKRREMSNRAIEKAQQFQMDNIARQWKELFEKAIERRGI
jgi:glycosyltransferase involved in cell wall biosynthesis